jgi:hypothetical protein
MALYRRLRSLRSLERQVIVLSNALADMLEDAEKLALGNWPGADYPRPARLCKILADEMRYGDDECNRDDLRRIKAARRALGLPAWWREP